ncbi:MAG TPA: DUF2085 domain-containing protein, partial [Candidatus Paceibacterota bacterium]|nr:DUF2085 domain-containing protein [Candidatus Paceibacterota bacterium]
MLDRLTDAFALVCGQNTGHTWLCAGQELPCCQRCTGLYLGALAAFVLLKFLRLTMTNRFLWIHGATLMLMVPFGFHWVPQNAFLRAASGVLFGFGLVAFLQLPLAKPNPPASETSESRHLGVYWI